MLGVLALLVLVFPLVASLFVRSHAALAWVAKLHYQQQATALAEEGEARALALLEAGGGAGEGDRLTADGGMHYRILFLSAAPGSTTLFLVAGEGVFRSEERMVVSVVEVSTAAGGRLLIPRDRSWHLPGAGGGTVVTEADLGTAHRQRVEAYLARLAQESALDAGAFVSRMSSQSQLLDCPEISAKWSDIASALAAAKAPSP